MSHKSLRKYTLLYTTNSRRHRHRPLVLMSFYDSKKGVPGINKRKVKIPKKLTAGQYYVSPLQRGCSISTIRSLADIILSEEDLEESNIVHTWSNRQRYENAYIPVSKSHEITTEVYNKSKILGKLKQKDVATNSKYQKQKILSKTSRKNHVLIPSSTNKILPSMILTGRRPLHDSQRSASTGNEASSPNVESLYFRKVKSSRFNSESCSLFTHGKSYKEDDCVQFVKEFKSSSSSPSFPPRKTKYKESEKKFTSSHKKLNAAGQTIQPNSHNSSFCSSSQNEDDQTLSKMECNTTTCNDSDRSSLQTTVLELSKNVDIAQDSEEDDLIVIPTSDNVEKYVDYFTLKKSIASILSHSAAEKTEQEITLQYVVQRLGTLYHQDFSKRMTEIEHCLKRAKMRIHSSHLKTQEIRPGVRQSDVDTLQPGEWLNDVVINQYMSILVDSCDDYSAISSFSHEELLRGKEPSLPINWQSYSGILIPICIESHWSLLKFKPSTMDISLYNSMALCKYEIKCAQKLQNFFRFKADMQNSGRCFKVENLPRQENEYDCGVYVCMFARCIVYGNSFNIMPAQVSAYRNWLKMEILSARLHGAVDEDNTDNVYESDNESGIECLE